MFQFFITRLFYKNKSCFRFLTSFFNNKFIFLIYMTLSESTTDVLGRRVIIYLDKFNNLVVGLHNVS